jgi:monoamine oxidase
MKERWSRRTLLAWAALSSTGCALGAGRAAGAGSTPGAPGPAAAPASSVASAAPGQSVIVVGGGLAGLACAYRLSQRGQSVLVLEATQRAGGRICTLRDGWQDGLFVEAGAAHLVPDPALLALLGELSVAAESRPPGPKLARVGLFAGQRRVVPPGVKAPRVVPLSAAEEAIGENNLMDHYFAEAKTYDPTGPFPAALLALDDISGAEYLRQQGASPGFLQQIDSMLGVGDDGLEGMSGLWLVHSWAQILREIALGPSQRIAGGTDRLPGELARRLGERIVYGARAVAVTQGETSVSVSFERNGERTTQTAERVVFAIPPTLLRALSITPALSAEKMKALEALPLESVTRIWLETDRRFWAERGEAGRVDTDLAIGPVRDESEGYPGAAGMLGFYATRAESRRLAELSEEQRIQTALEYAAKGHPGLREHFLTGASLSWDKQPFQRGAYAYFKRGQVRALAPYLGSREGRCHFCGDHTSQRPGFMHGALASALRVVAEIPAPAG